MKVSIIIPVYNVEKYLEQCLDSAVNQTLKDIEIIIVNDGSTDSSYEIVDKYKGENIVVIDQINKGSAGARNSGLRVAKGEYIYFLDSDDYIELNAMEICYNAAKQSDSDIVIFDANIFSESGTIGNLKRSTFMNECTLSGKEVFNLLVENNCDFVAPWMNFFKKSFLKEIGIEFQEGIIYEDILHTIKSFILACKITYLPMDLYNYRHRENSVTTKSVTIKNVEGHYISAKELYKFYLDNKNHLDKRSKNALIKAIQYYYRLSIIDCDRLLLFDKRKEIISSLKESKDILSIELNILMDCPIIYYNNIGNELIDKPRKDEVSYIGQINLEKYKKSKDMIDLKYLLMRIDNHLDVDNTINLILKNYILDENFIKNVECLINIYILNKVDVLNKLGIEFFNNDLFDCSINLFLIVLKEKRDDIDTIYNISYVLFSLEEYEMAYSIIVNSDDNVKKNDKLTELYNLLEEKLYE